MKNVKKIEKIRMGLKKKNENEKFDMVILFQFLLYYEILKFWSNQTNGWKCTCHTSRGLCHGYFGGNGSVSIFNLDDINC